LTEEDYLMWLSLVPGITFKRECILIEYFGSAHDIWAAPDKLISCVKDIPENVLQNIVSSRNADTVLKYKEDLEKQKIYFIAKQSNKYPRLLKEIINAPFGIYVLGKIPNDAFTKVAIIGSRKFSQYGSYATTKISSDLAKNNIVIVSGMARGIDSCAHKSAIDAGGITIAVMGCGLDICYPPENKDLYNKIVMNGCLISEYPLGTKPFVGNFPMRNRIISGISNGIIVIEASDKSGTFITVEHAIKQNRKVMAVPGLINSEFSYGTNQLIKDGAHLVCNYEDVLKVLEANNNKNIIDIKFNKNTNMHQQNKMNEDSKKIILEKNEQMVYEIIKDQPTNFDFILSKTNLSVSSISSLLTILELKGAIKKLAGRNYIRV
jgi:DNA processing protein